MKLYLIGVFTPLLTAALAIPLILQRVPPNIWYGFRTSKTLSDPRIWYQANATSGRYLLVASLLSLALGAGLIWLGQDLPENQRVVWSALGNCAAIVTALAASFVQLRKL
ncbi:MAG: SdpI family protein [Acidobacteria bacterium]|nr:SdpI family protein [Acidobacteriota bacterium]